MATCIDCGGTLARGEVGPCLPCEVKHNKKREAEGRGEKICRDCNALFYAVDYDGNDVAIVNDFFPECDSDDVEPLSVVQERCAERMDGAL